MNYCLLYKIVSLIFTHSLSLSLSVCSLFADNENGLLLSGSWDQNCHVWKDNKTKKVLKGHNAAVWAVASLQRMIFTASADKTIKRWDEKGECVFTYTQHTDCVRGLAILSKERFLSCSNDATIKLWNVSDGSVIHSFTGHDNFIYDIAVIDTNPDNPEFLSCSEDRTVRIWKGLKDSFQSIRLPAPTAWSVAVIDKLNIAIAGSDGRVYTFTRDDSRVADESEIKTFEDEVGKSEVPLAELGDIKVDQLPGKEALMNPGKKEGATKLVREDGKICVYQWSQGKMEWSKVGDVVGDANPDKDPSSKTVFEGKEYDFVFNVDIEDGVPPLKLPFNAGDDPWMAAQQFIYKYNLSQLYLDQIANFIIKNAGDLSSSNNSSRTNQQASSEYVDPWTGGSRYIPQPK